MNWLVFFQVLGFMLGVAAVAGLSIKALDYLGSKLGVAATLTIWFTFVALLIAILAGLTV